MDALWKPHEGQQTLALQVDDVSEILYGGSRGGGKTDAGIVWLLKESNNPDFRGLVIRKNSEDLADWIDRAGKLYTNATISGKPATIKFPSGAIIRTGHLKDDQAYTKYQGHEYHRIVIEELTQIPTEESYLKLISSCRSTVEGLTPQIFATANPGGKGHNWVKQRWQIGLKPVNKSFPDPVSKRLRMFIPATVDDNPTLVKSDPDYVRFLDSLPEPLRSAWRNGDWNVFAGQYFAEFHPRIHHISEDNAKRLGYGRSYNSKYIGIDWGFANPFACVWIEVTPNNRVFCYRELYGTEKHPAQWGEQISELSREESIVMSMGDPSMWQRNPMSWNKPENPMYSPTSVANGLIGDPSRPLVPNLQPANNNRVNGWRNLAQLMHFTDKKAPNFFIVQGSCPNLLRTIPMQIRDEKNPEDVDTTGEDHILDALRYALSSVIAPVVPKKKLTKIDRDIERLKQLPLDNNDWNWSFNE